MAFSAIRKGVLYLGAAVVLALTAAGTALLTQTKEALNRAQDTPLLSAATAEERADFLAQYGITVDTTAEQAVNDILQRTYDIHGKSLLPGYLPRRRLGLGAMMWPSITAACL